MRIFLLFLALIVLFLHLKLLIFVLVTRWLETKNIKYKFNRSLIVKSISFNGFNHVTIFAMDYGFHRIIECKFKDLEFY